MTTRLTPVCGLLATFALAVVGQAQQTHRYRFQGDRISADLKRSGVKTDLRSPGHILPSSGPKNTGSWRFDGRRAIAYAVPSRVSGFESNFTWEGFFLTPASNATLAETGIADRLITQFAFDKGDWTRLAIGLTSAVKKQTRLSVSLEGFEGRTFGRGRQTVTPNRWHHFALVHEGTSAAARIRWYLDYSLCGEIFLGGQANQNTLRPPGSAPMTIGARLQNAGGVNRGFEGLIDEIRLTPRPLKVSEFLRSSTGRSASPAQTALSPDHETFWSRRHQWARRQAARWPGVKGQGGAIDTYFRDRKEASRIDDAGFLRRLSLTVQGRIPTLLELQTFLSDRRPDRRARAIDRLLLSPEWADSWVGYWQDVLAENPSVVFPTLNNSGPFRQWIYESFRHNVPFDRFVTELTMMEGGEQWGVSPAGFALATGNDAPMVMRTHVLMKAFAAVDLKCARCHDSPIGPEKQSDLFGLAALLNGGPLKVPATSVAAVAKAGKGLITTSLKPGQSVAPFASTRWFSSPRSSGRAFVFKADSRPAELASLLTSPADSRFSDVIANRLWQRFFGEGLIEPVDRWDSTNGGRKAALLRTLSRELVDSGYDLQRLARRILRSEAWQARRKKRQRLSAEQLVDSLFVAVGKDFEAETLGIHATDPGASQLPRPRRAWQYSALPNERDRPALVMPVSQTIVDVLTAFGWNGNRQQPRTVREESPTALQPLILLNGLMSQRIVRLSDRSSITELCLQKIPLSTLVDRLFLTLLSRRPDADERKYLVGYLRDTFETRRTGQPARSWQPLSTFQPDWRKHLQPEQTRLLLQAQRRVARGEMPTDRLSQSFRERMEDVVWALVNSPEFVIIP